MTDVASLASIEREIVESLSAEEKARLDLAIQGRGVLTFRQFIRRVNPRYRFYAACEKLIAVLQLVADGVLFRVIIMWPPRHGKSETLSRLFSAYLLYRHPDRWTALVSYAGDLAMGLSRNARTNYEAIGRRLHEGAGSVRQWETGSGGGFWAAGIGGGQTGKGFHFGIIDDPVKDAEEANSETIAKRNRNWYSATFATRAEPRAAIVVCQTRWPGPADFVGWLFEQEQGGEEEPERWHVVAFDALHEKGRPMEIPKSCTLEPDEREEGEALIPERYDAEALRKKRRIGTYYFSALYQQRPVPEAGVMFPRTAVKFVTVGEIPAGLRDVRYWDKAGTEGAGAYTAGVRMRGGGEDGFVYVVEVVRAQYAAIERRKLMRTTAELDGYDVDQHIEQEPGSSGKDSAADDVRNMAGFSVFPKPATGDKVLRARPLSAQWQAGNVRIVRGEWNKDYLDEMEGFPFRKLKDQADASSGAYNELAGGGFWLV